MFLPVEWSVSKDGKNIPLSEAFDASLTPKAGKITFKGDGEYVLTAAMTDYLKRKLFPQRKHPHPARWCSMLSPCRRLFTTYESFEVAARGCFGISAAAMCDLDTGKKSDQYRTVSGYPGQ